MELALPHVVVRICGAGVGRDLVAALGVHPVEVSEARSESEARRVAGGRPPVLVVVTDPPDASTAIAETWTEFPRTPILLVAPPATDTSDPARVPHGPGREKGWVDSIPGDLPLTELCWHVMEAVSRAALLAPAADHPLGPVLLEVDDTGRVTSSDTAPEGLLVDGRRIRTGESLVQLVAPADRGPFAETLGRLQDGEVRFTTVRLLDSRGGTHAAATGIRRLTPGRSAVLMQPIIASGPVAGRHINNRDPITGLLTRWAMSRVLEKRAQSGATRGDASLVVLKLEDFAAVGNYIGSWATDVVLVRVASALSGIFPYPAVGSRPMGDTFVVFLPDTGVDDALDRSQRWIEAVNGIEVPGFAADFQLHASVGIAGVSRGDYDLALRRADAAVTAARAAGGNRAVVAGPAFTGALAAEMNAKMELGEWEVWLQRVAASADNHDSFHEALARFCNGRGRLISRPDFFTAGWGQGLLERFDQMMLRRVLQILVAHPDARLSVNVSLETFLSDAFPGSFLDLIREVPDGCGRIVLEIASHCLAAPAKDVLRRLEALAAAGVAVALDDFGSGVCRLTYLTQYPLAMVKLDELVTGYVDDDPLQREFVRAVVNICRARGITTVAEYTRSPEQLERLVEDGVDLFQGELLGMPAPAAQVLAQPEAAGAGGGGRDRLGATP